MGCKVTLKLGWDGRVQCCSGSNDSWAKMGFGRLGYIGVVFVRKTSVLGYSGREIEALGSRGTLCRVD